MRSMEDHTSRGLIIHVEMDSPSQSPYDLIIQRLFLFGVPNDNLNDGYRGLVNYVKNNRSQLGLLLSAILPFDNDDDNLDENVFREILTWLKWLMFENEPEIALEQLAESKRGVCGAIWGKREIAFKCRTCELDPTCAICVPCFENGDHEGHDYFIITTGGGCCDCGDINAWKREGFCLKHKGVEHVQPLADDVSVTVGPVLDFMVSYWKDKLVLAESVLEESSMEIDRVEVADELTSGVVDMLMELCKESESLLVFIAGRICSLSGLLEVLLRGERFLNDVVVRKLHELLLNLLSEPVFKHEFARLFAAYYPSLINSVVSEGSDSAFRKYPLVSTFSVQILTVPGIIPRLVEEMDLMGIFLQSLGNIFEYCIGEDGKLQVTKLADVFDTTRRLFDDIIYVMSHSPVIQYICYSRRDLVRTWMELLFFVQGMGAQKRETGRHIEDEDEHLQLSWILLRSMSKISSLLVAGAFSGSSNMDIKGKAILNLYKMEDEDQETLRHAKVIKLRLESSTGSVTGKNLVGHETNASYEFPIPPSALWFTYECLRSIGNLLELDNMAGPLSVSSRQSVYGSGYNLMKRTLSKCRSGSIFRLPTLSSNTSRNRSITSEALDKHFLSPTGGGYNVDVGLDFDQTLIQLESDYDENMLEGQCVKNLEGLRVLSVSDWPDISYCVSSQFISLHIPLHRVLSSVLHRALKECYDESVSSNGDFFGRILEGFHPYGFSGYVMEHPLRIRVFCAQVRAGMWRRNGDAPILFNGWYHSVRKSEQTQELDLFLLQCCGALAPPDLFVHRILDRFGLSDYLSLDMEQPSENEPTLVVDMLTLLVQIVKERRLCGLTPAELLKKELIYRLSVGDATHSQLLDSLSHDLSQLKQLQEVLDTVAEYSHPSGMAQGMYKLRSSYWKELDLYNPHSNSRDQQAAEERYLRFCNFSALTNQLPKWTKIYYPLKGIAKIATCKTLLQIVRSVLFYAVFTNKLVASRAPDGVLLISLHLLALSLDVCRVHRESGDPSCYVGDTIPILAFACEGTTMGNYGEQSLLSLLVLLMKMHEKDNRENLLESGNFSLSFLILDLIKKFVSLEPELLTKLEKLAPQLADQFSCAALNGKVKDADTVSDNEKRKAKARERQAAILEKMRAQQSKFLESFNSNEDEEMTDAKFEQEVSSDSEMVNELTESSEVMCSLCHDPKSRGPLSYLVLFQKSRLLTFVGRETPTRKQFAQSGKEHVSSCTTRSYDATSSSILHDPDMIQHCRLLESIQSAVNDFASIGKSSEVYAFIEFVKAKFGCINNVRLPSVSKDAREMPSSYLEAWEEDAYSFIRSSSFSLRRTNSENNERVTHADTLLLGKYIAGLPKETFDKPSDSHINRSLSETSTVHQGYDKFGPSGGDGIHVSSCGHAVHQDCLDRYLLSLRERYTRRIIFEGGHIVDPDQGEFLCPVCRGIANSAVPAYPRDSTKVPQSLPSSADASSASFHLQDGLSLLHRAADIAGSTDILNTFVTQNAKIPQNIKSALRFLCGMHVPGNDNILESGRAHPSLILWDTLKYSLISTEIAARSTKGSLKPNYSISALYKEINSTTGFILSMLLNLVESTQLTSSSSSVLLRLRGTQLFAKSLCHGAVSYDSCQAGGNMLCILENEEIQYPDIQLWRRANEPVLTGDAFSSLMLVLYCLPRPVLSCKESLLSLVHTFYLVAVIQALCMCCKRSKTIDTDVLSGNPLIGDVYRVMRECAEDALFFDSSDLDPAYDLRDSVRSLTFPYLRRCALLWKLLTSSNSVVPFSYGSASELDSPILHTVEELAAIEKLEKLFNIPTLSIIFTDERSRAAALGWLDEPRRASVPVLRCLGAIPFKLILLPHIYLDLLQRFMKKSCPDCGVVKDEPALCLLCGKLCSPNWKPCCRKNSCQTHATTCGAGTGVFLLIRKTTILLQRLTHQEFWPSPYLDAFGEEDNGMARGKPLFLNEERYAALTHMVASHGLDRSSKLHRRTTFGAFLMI